MSAFSTVGDVFSDLEFVAPGSALLWGTGVLDRNLQGLHRLPHHASASAHMEGSFTQLLHVLTTPILVLDLVTTRRTSLSSFTFASPTFWAPTALCAVLKLSNVAWNVLLAKTAACVFACGLHSSPPRTLWPRSQSSSHSHTPPRPQHSASTVQTGKLHAPHRHCTSAPTVNDFQCFIAGWHAALVTLATPGVPCQAHFRDVLMRFVPVFSVFTPEMLV